MTSSRSLLSTLALSCAVSGAALTPAFAGPEVNITTGAVLVDGKPAPGLAIHGYDPVAYFTDKRAVLGDHKFAVVHKEATYRFASKASLDTFKANPAKYEPAYGGYCAFGVSVNAKFDGDPMLWTIQNDRLYLNLDAGIKAAFDKDVAGNIKKADANWPGIAAKLPSEIK
jgi:hypothetical protein